MPTETFDILRFQRRARHFVQTKGWHQCDADDLVQEMCRDVLEHPDRWHGLGRVYLHAYDRLDPRTHRRSQDARRLRKSELLHGPSLDAPLPWDSGDSGTLYDVLAAPELALRDPLALQWLARHLARLDARTAYVMQRYFWEEVPMRQIGKEVGLGEARISQLITATLRHISQDEAPQTHASDTPDASPDLPGAQRHHSQALRRQGWTVQAIAAQTGLPSRQVWRSVYFLRRPAVPGISWQQWPLHVEIAWIRW